MSKTVLLRDTCTQATPEQTLAALISHWGLEQRCIFANSMLAMVSPTSAHHMKGCLARLATLSGACLSLKGVEMGTFLLSAPPSCAPSNITIQN